VSTAVSAWPNCELDNFKFSRQVKNSNQVLVSSFTPASCPQQLEISRQPCQSFVHPGRDVVKDAIHHVKLPRNTLLVVESICAYDAIYVDK